MIRVRARRDDVLLRSGEEIPPGGVAEVTAEEAMYLHGLGLVDLLSSAPGRDREGGEAPADLPQTE